MEKAPHAGQQQPIYELEANALEVIGKCKEKLLHVCSQHVHKPVRVQTVHGQTFDGIIVHVDNHHLYLQTLPGHSRALLPGPYPYFPYYSYYSNVILPLVLFDLLAITLLI
ncbi:MULTISPECIES: hypothetical protein [Paenibacillus]|uniref:hypothetical protein n=1 Tax=Paenibacillus TaxID=44249 RepID=UPI00087EC6BA|nr:MULTISPECIES: hypothetical protein [Paenibacillus]NTZ18940.1 hypothetical protein [Paenibacillus sp. JMULE4]SDI19882.1 hypothetical protein SAMN05421868_10442 [Paenibacillus naphthalenovorans]